MNLNSDEAEATENAKLTENSKQMSNESTTLLAGPSTSTSYSNNKPSRTPYRRSSSKAKAIRNQLQLVMNDTRTRSAQNVSFIILLIVNCCERFAYYGIICNYILFLNKLPLDWASYNASALLLIFLGITFMSSLIGGWLADSLIGKYLTILISYVIYIIGYSIFPLISYDMAYSNPMVPFQVCNVNTNNITYSNSSLLTGSSILTVLHNVAPRSILDERCSLPVLFSVITMGIAVGILKANLGPFGADQVASRGQPMIFKYFSWLYWSINLGSLLSFTLLAFVQQNVSFFIGYLVPLLVLVFSFLLFLSGSGCYVKTKSESSVLSNIFRVIIEAFRSVKRQKNLIRQKERERALLSEGDESNRSTDSIYEGYNSTQSLSNSFRKNTSWLDNAKIRYGGRYDDGLVDDVKALYKVIILFAILIPYWAVYLQVESMFVVQGLHLKVLKDDQDFFGHDKIIMPVAWLSLSDQLTILFLIPLLDYVIYPLLQQDIKVTGNLRLVIGMSFSAFAVILAGLLETYRIHYILEDPASHVIMQTISNTTYQAANLTIFWQIPQYICVGFGEVFCSVTAVYYAYSIAPKSMESILMGLFFFFTGVGSFLGSILLAAFKSIIYSSKQSDDLNCSQCRLYYYFYALASLQIVGVLAFIYLDRKFFITVEREREDNNILTGNERTLFTPNLDSTVTSTQDLDSSSEEGHSESFNSPVYI